MTGNNGVDNHFFDRAPGNEQLDDMQQFDDRIFSDPLSVIMTLNSERERAIKNDLAALHETDEDEKKLTEYTLGATATGVATFLSVKYIGNPLHVALIISGACSAAVPFLASRFENSFNDHISPLDL